jgi:hypothetical protein
VIVKVLFFFNTPKLFYIKPNTAQVATHSPDPGPLRLSRSLHTVRELWKEYKEGFNGQPSVENEEPKGKNNRYKQGQSEARFYNRRAPIWNQVKKISLRLQISGETAADRLQEYMDAESAPRSLNWLSERILAVSSGKEVWGGSGTNLLFS